MLSTLWSVADDTTAEFMVRFYRHFNAGQPKDQALRLAQMELIRGPIVMSHQRAEPRTIDASPPYFWAAFQIMGDWR